MNEILTILILIIILILIGYAYLATRKPSEYKKRVALKLAELSPLINSNEINQMKSALFEIDKLLDFVMKSKKIKGETMGERLKNSQKHLDWNDYQKTWEAHKLRNKIAHEMDFHPKIDEVKSAYGNLKKTVMAL